jgi:hypothetical protein
MNYLIGLFVSIALGINSLMFIPFSEIELAFQQADAAKIMEFSKSKVIISIDGNESVYSQSQGTLVLKTFFKSNPPKSFTYTFKGTEKNMDSYALGRYVSETGFYKVNLKFQKEKDTYKIESLAIQREVR